MNPGKDKLCYSERGLRAFFLLACILTLGFVPHVHAVSLPETGQTTCYFA